jgi:hypothetical protein
MVNYLAVLVSSIVGMAIGALWYSPVLFGKLWMQWNNVDAQKLKESQEKGMIKNYIVSFVSVLIMMYILGYFMDLTNVVNVYNGLFVGIALWLGLIATVMINSVLWDDKPVKLYILNISHYLVVLVVASVILSLWT